MKYKKTKRGSYWQRVSPYQKTRHWWFIYKDEKHYIVELLLLSKPEAKVFYQKLILSEYVGFSSTPPKAIDYNDSLAGIAHHKNYCSLEFHIEDEKLLYEFVDSWVNYFTQVDTAQVYVTLPQWLEQVVKYETC